MARPKKETVPVAPPAATLQPAVPALGLSLVSILQRVLDESGPDDPNGYTHLEPQLADSVPPEFLLVRRDYTNAVGMPAVQITDAGRSYLASFEKIQAPVQAASAPPFLPPVQNMAANTIAPNNPYFINPQNVTAPVSTFEFESNVPMPAPPSKRQVGAPSIYPIDKLTPGVALFVAGEGPELTKKVKTFVANQNRKYSGAKPELGKRRFFVEENVVRSNGTKGLRIWRQE